MKKHQWFGYEYDGLYEYSKDMLNDVYTDVSSKFMEEIDKSLLKEVYQTIAREEEERKTKEKQKHILESLLPVSKDNTPVFTTSGIPIKVLKNRSGFGVDINGDVKWIMK